VIGARTATELAAIAHARLGGVTRQLSQLESSGKPLLHRQLLVARGRFQLRAPVRELVRHSAPSVVLLDRTLLRHPFAPCRSADEDLTSLLEREVKRGKQRTRFIVVARAGANGDVKAPGIGNLVEIDLRKHGVFFDSQAVVAATIETLWIEAAEIAHA